jgi:hypothetical protein
MVEIEAAWPWVRLEDRPQDRIGQSRQREDDEYVPSGMADRASEMRTGVRVNDLLRMQPGVGHLDEQNHERHDTQEDPIGRATSTDRHRNLETLMRHAARQHRPSQSRSGSYDG